MIIGICDDEIRYVKELDKLISTYSFKNNIDITVKSFTCLSALAAEVISLDIIFLDIRFNHETLGVEWAKKLRKQGNTNMIVFCSSLKDMVIQGYEAEAFRFLVKPVVEAELFKILDACINTMKEIF